MRNQAPAFSIFAWQEGFGVISVSSNTDAAVKYIENQKNIINPLHLKMTLLPLG